MAPNEGSSLRFRAMMGTLLSIAAPSREDLAFIEQQRDHN
jgi:hypothetical protein